LSADFLSGSSGTVTSRRAALRDLLLDARLHLDGTRRRLSRAARSDPPPRRVLVVGVVAGSPRMMDAAVAELRRSRHDVHTCIGRAGSRGKFENLNHLLGEHPAPGHDWLLIVDDDVVLPAGFLDRFLFLAERFELRLAQPAHRRRSHAAWEVTRRHPSSVLRETALVEIGPVTALHAETFDDLLPFPELRMGWGLDAHWAALARERGWRAGVIDALPVAHRARTVGSGYSSEAAVEEARGFLEGRPYLPATELGRVHAVHRRW
jgi:hypothetical protein